jgi:hypothetical protein
MSKINLLFLLCGILTLLNGLYLVYNYFIYFTRPAIEFILSTSLWDATTITFLGIILIYSAFLLEKRIMIHIIAICTILLTVFNIIFFSMHYIVDRLTMYFGFFWISIIALFLLYLGLTVFVITKKEIVK